jgi:putative redox protein
MDKQIRVKYLNGMHLEGHSAAFDAPIPLDAGESVGGQGLGHRPLQMLLIGLGGCMLMDTLSILRKKRQDFSDLEVSFEVTQAADHPKKYTAIKMHFRAAGADISAEALARALELSYTKYCPANAMLSAAAEVSYSYEIVTTPG